MRALFIRAIPAIFVLTVLAAPGAAQERCKWSSDSDPGSVSSYPQQLNIDVGDAPGHIVGVYEIHTVAGLNAKPNCEGLKDKESWSHGLRDYHDRNGRVSGYTVTTLENGDKIYKELSGTTETTVAPDGSTKTTTETVATWTGGTGHYQAVRGIERGHTAVDWAKGELNPQAFTAPRTANIGSRNSLRECDIRCRSGPRRSGPCTDGDRGLPRRHLLRQQREGWPVAHPPLF